MTQPSPLAPQASSFASLSPDERLMFAALEGSVDRIKQALADGARCDFEPEGLTPLKIAALHRHAHCLGVLIQAERDQAPGTIKAFSQRVLRAVENLKFQLRRSARLPEPQLKHSRRSALFQAAQAGSVECVRALIEHNDPNAPDLDGQTPLMIAAFSGHASVVQTLLPHSDALRLDRCGRDALILAVEGESIEAVRLLLPFSDPARRAQLLPFSDPARRVQTPGTHFGLTALWIAAQRQLPEIVRLLAPVSDLDAVDSYGRDALRLALLSGKASILDPIANASSLAALINARNALSGDLSINETTERFARPRLQALIEERELGRSLPAPSRSPDAPGPAKPSRRL